jgi:hypothetical protein
MFQDLQYSLRQLRKSPGLSLVVILTLAAGIGAMTTVMTWANAVMFNPWPQARDAQQLRFISAQVQACAGILRREHDEEAEYEQQERRGEEPPSSRAFASQHQDDGHQERWIDEPRPCCEESAIPPDMRPR